MSFRYLIVDEYWTHVGWFESEIPDWSVGREFVLSDGRRLAILLDPSFARSSWRGPRRIGPVSNTRTMAENRRLTYHPDCS